MTCWFFLFFAHNLKNIYSLWAIQTIFFSLDFHLHKKKYLATTALCKTIEQRSNVHGINVWGLLITDLYTVKQWARDAP